MSKHYFEGHIVPKICYISQFAYLDIKKRGEMVKILFYHFFPSIFSSVPTQ